MGYSAILGGTEQVPLASTRGWMDAKDWIDTLEPVETYLRLIQLAEHGWTHSLSELRSQIVAALKEFPPDDPTVADTMAGLIETLRGQTAESIFVSDGTAEDNGEADDGWDVGEFDTAPSDTKTLAVETPNITRTANDRIAGKVPNVPDFNRLGDVAMATLDVILTRLSDALEKMQPVGEILAEVDRLVMQVEFASRIAGAVGLWHETGEQLYTLDLPPEIPDWFLNARKRRFPWLEDATNWLIDKGVYSGREIEGIALESEAGAQRRWKSVKELETLRAEVVAGLVSGESFQSFNARVKDLVTATKPMLETAFRTATHQAYMVGQTMTLEKPLIKTLFPAVEYHATHDTRVRDTHRALDMRIFEVGSEAYDIAKRALADFNCRCVCVALQRSKLKSKPAPQQTGDLPAEVLAHYA